MTYIFAIQNKYRFIDESPSPICAMMMASLNFTATLFYVILCVSLAGC